MAIARIVDGFWTGVKRRRTEIALLRTGHAWATDPVRGLMCAGEGIARLLAWLDGRGDPAGSLAGVTDAELEFEAGWTGTPGAFASALRSCGWIDATPEGPRWHDFGSLNGKALANRRNGRHGGRPPGQDRGTGGGAPEAGAQPTRNPPPNPQGNPRGNSSGNGSGSGSGKGSVLPQREDVAAAAAPSAPSAAGDVPAGAPKSSPRKRTPSIADVLAAELARALASTKRICRAQIVALLDLGWTPLRIREAIQTHARPGLEPWNWTKLALGSTGGARRIGPNGPQLGADGLGELEARARAEELRAEAR